MPAHPVCSTLARPSTTGRSHLIPARSRTRSFPCQTLARRDRASSRPAPTTRSAKRVSAARRSFHGHSALGLASRTPRVAPAATASTVGACPHADPGAESATSTGDRARRMRFHSAFRPAAAESRPRPVEAGSCATLIERCAPGRPPPAAPTSAPRAPRTRSVGRASASKRWEHRARRVPSTAIASARPARPARRRRSARAAARPAARCSWARRSATRRCASRRARASRTAGLDTTAAHLRALRWVTAFPSRAFPVFRRARRERRASWWATSSAASAVCPRAVVTSAGRTAAGAHAGRVGPVPRARRRAPASVSRRRTRRCARRCRRAVGC